MKIYFNLLRVFAFSLVLIATIGCTESDSVTKNGNNEVESPIESYQSSDSTSDRVYLDDDVAVAAMAIDRAAKKQEQELSGESIEEQKNAQ